MPFKFENTLRFAKQLDKLDNLRSFRSKFFIPKMNGRPCIYFSGHSLGLQSKNTKQFVNKELTDWASLGVQGHEHAKRPWLYYHKFSKKLLSKIVGAKPAEVIAMNQLTINLHLMMVSFYRPTKQRYKIIAEAGAFSSDQYALESQIKFHGLDAADTLIELTPRHGEYTLRTEDILECIKNNATQVALILLGGVQYYTGQVFDIKKITEAGHNAEAIVGFDLAHAVGNIVLQLHRHNVDFAVWCSYKYLNSGPGGIAGAFIHEKHFEQPGLLRFAGWWGHNEEARFEMKKGFIPMHGIDGWQISNVPIFQAAAHLASLELFQQAGMKALRKKSIYLTGYLEYLLKGLDPDGKYFKIITPSRQEERGCQLSIFFKANGRKIFNALNAKNISVDWRNPDVIRLAPVPLYNSFEEVFRFSKIFESVIKRLALSQ